MKPAKDFTQPKRGSLNRSGSTMDTTKPMWKARVSRPFTRMNKTVTSFSLKRG